MVVYNQDHLGKIAFATISTNWRYHFGVYSCETQSTPEQEPYEGQANTYTYSNSNNQLFRCNFLGIRY